MVEIKVKKAGNVELAYILYMLILYILLGYILLIN